MHHIMNSVTFHGSKSLQAKFFKGTEEKFSALSQVIGNPLSPFPGEGTATGMTATVQILDSPMVPSAGGTDRDQAAPQIGRNWGAVQYYKNDITIILKLKVYNFIVFYNIYSFK